MAEPRQKKRGSWLPKLILLLLAGGVVYWLFFSGDKSGKNIRSQAPVSIAAVTRKDVPVYLAGLGTIQAYNTVTVHSQVDGQLITVQFTEGQNVKAGDVLAKIDPRTFKAQYDQAVANKAKDEATLANARLDLTRYINLGNSVSGQTLDTQRATVLQLEAMVKADQAAIDNTAAELSYTVIASPIAGRTGIRQVDNGNVIHASDVNGLVVITQLQPISVIFSLPQQSLQAINAQLNDQNKLEVDALADDNKTVVDTGILELVDNEIDQTTGTIRLKATFPNQKNMLWPGGFTNVRLLLTIKQNVLVVPTVAVQRGPQNPYVFIYHPAKDGYVAKGAQKDAPADKGPAEEKDSVEMRTVKVNMTADQDTVIDEGVQEGEQVVTDGMAKLQDGSKVELAGQNKEGYGKETEGAKSDAVKPASTQIDPQKGARDSSGDAPSTEKKHRHKQEQQN